MMSSRSRQERQGKRFFFEKKSQKTFIHLASCLPARPRSQTNKRFCFFFQKEALTCFFTATAGSIVAAKAARLLRHGSGRYSGWPMEGRART
jgi:hypothetical protein